MERLDGGNRDSPCHRHRMSSHRRSAIGPSQRLGVSSWNVAPQTELSGIDCLGRNRGADGVDTRMNDIASLLNRDDTTIAVVCATDDPSKYGSVIYLDLKRKGFDVYAVNPNRDTVDGDPAFSSLAEVPDTPTIVNVVVPAVATLNVLRSARELGLNNVWVQPGAESPEVMAYLNENDFNYLANACIMVRSRVKSGL